MSNLCFNLGMSRRFKLLKLYLKLDGILLNIFCYFRKFSNSSSRLRDWFIDYKFTFLQNGDTVNSNPYVWNVV